MGRSTVRTGLVIAGVLIAGWGVPAVSALCAQPAGLEYKYREPYKNADYYLSNIEQSLDDVRAQVNGATAKDAPEAQANIDALRKFLLNASNHLKNLPTADKLPAVAPLHERAAAAAKAIDELQAALDDRVKGTRAAVDAEAVAIQADTNKLIEWGNLFANPETAFGQEPEVAIMIAERISDVENEWRVIQERRAALLDPSNHSMEARSMQPAASFFQRSLPRFKEHMEVLKQRLPKQIEGEQKRNGEAIDRAIADKNTVLLAGTGTQLGRSDELLRILCALDAQICAPVKAAQDALRARWVQASKTLRGDIIKGNEAPKANYAGDDVARLREMVVKAWMEQHPKDEVLAVVFNTPGWKRTTRWDWNVAAKGFEKVDFSHIQPKIIVKFDATLALVVPVDIYKDHLQGDAIRLSPWAREADPNPRNLLLLERVQK